MSNLTASKAVDILIKRFPKIKIKSMVELKESYIIVIGDEDSIINPIGVNKTTGKLESFSPFSDKADEFFSKLNKGEYLSF